jgi:hypothetical protein
MRDFYAAIRAGAKAPEALRRAKLAAISSRQPGRRSLRNWAPFVLVGDAEGAGRS